jgi:Fuc2NAc and GlcNAc transferase
MWRLAGTAALGFVVALALTRVALAYARRHHLVDEPGHRRSHVVATPRGGGIGIVAALLLVAVPAWYLHDAAAGATVAAVACAWLAVAAVGWRDDLAAMPVWPRLAVHVLAALLVGVAVVASAAPVAWWFAPALAVVLVGCINAHNFMDGIDGILGLQGLFAFAALGALALGYGDGALAPLAFAAAAGCGGFLVFNLPPARIFMGDVGSGTLGLAIGTAGALLVARQPPLFWAAAIVPSAFLVDSGLTLARRVVAGQRWYAPHRQHLYQWLVRVNWSHARTDLAYMTWNLAVVAPLAAWAAVRPDFGPTSAAIAYGAAALAWFAGKRACLAAAGRRRTDEAV